MASMWWIRTRAKIIIPVLLVVAAVVAAAFILPSMRTSSDVVNPGDDATGVRVTTDKDGKIIVTGRDPSEVKLSLALPQNCAQISVFMKEVSTLYPDSVGATDDVRVHVTIMQRLAQDLCSFREYNVLSKDQFTAWYSEWQTAPGGATSTSVPGGDASTTDGALPADTSVVDPSSSSTNPTEATSTTVTGG